MSSKRKINGLTFWTNHRLSAYGSQIEDVTRQLLEGFHLQQLLHSFTCKSLKKLKSLDGLTSSQKSNRLQWFIDELIKFEVLKEDVDCDSISNNPNKHLPDLLWKLISHDICFIWQRVDFLELKDVKILSSFIFKWTPDPPPKKKKKILLTEDAFMNKESSIIDEDEMIGCNVFPGSDEMKSFKTNSSKIPSAHHCIIQMINIRLKNVSEGKKMKVKVIEDVSDIHVLCGVVNSFLPNTFTTEILLNDRWTVNLLLTTISNILQISNPVTADDIYQGDHVTISSFFCVIFANFYRLLQVKAVLARLKEVNLLMEGLKIELKKISDEDQMERHLNFSIDQLVQERSKLRQTYDVEEMTSWLKHVRKTQSKALKVITKKIQERFEEVEVKRALTINDFCEVYGVNLKLTQGSLFIFSTSKQSCSSMKKMILKRKRDGKYFDNFTDKESKEDFHHLIPEDINEINPNDFRDYDFFFECKSCNKMLRSGNRILYQVFPGDFIKWRKMIFTSIRENDLQLFNKLLIFFQVFNPKILSSTDHSSNSLLHTAAKFGRFHICRNLLRSGCDLNTRSSDGSTPLFLAARHLHCNLCQLLLEWGADSGALDFRGRDYLCDVKLEKMKDFLRRFDERRMKMIPKIKNGDQNEMLRLLEDHQDEIVPLIDLEALCVNGTSLLHVATHFNHLTAIEMLLQIRFDANVEDFQGSTALHRCRSVRALQLLIDGNSDLSIVDHHGNSCLHSFCHGGDDVPTFIDGIRFLLQHGCDVTTRNDEQLMPIHCAAMQGRRDAIEVLMEDHEEEIRKLVEEENVDRPPSLPCLALTHDHWSCTKWLLEERFRFKDDEVDQLLYQLLMGHLPATDRQLVAQLLVDNGAKLDYRYKDNNTVLHLAASLKEGATEMMKMLISREVDVNLINSLDQTAIFTSIQSHDMFATQLLIKSGADTEVEDARGKSCFDYIDNFEMWIDSNLFDSQTITRLKLYNLKWSKNLVKSISTKINEEIGQDQT